jgi:MarR family transcriptional regulator, transcriptional regulator for hemolysin
MAKLADENDEEYFSVLSKSDRQVLTSILKKMVTAHKLTKMPIE